ncbi:lamin tail domain-containing protein [Marinilabilia salmonicolor]|uniref:lamin tail domain-containing protein n=1 Tax=Marinilabilia salmonicolor TaxID=989 RepID=UPI00029A665B|nr:lamin tail domain-containing protein [Marinilabilia salmonicolor]
MKPIFFHLLTITLLFLTNQLISATSFQDFPFSWTGDTEWFIYHPEENTVQLNAPETSEKALLLHPSTAFEDAVWTTGFRMEFNPSSSNYLTIILVADDVDNFHNGFFLMAGTTNDNISLWERKNGTDNLLIKGIEDRLNSSPAIARARVSRRKGGHWTLESDTGNGWQTEGSITYKRGMPSSYAGFSCHYTQTRRDKFFLEPLEISGTAYRDTVPPCIESIEIKNGFNVLLAFSEPVSEQMSSGNITIPGTEENIHHKTLFDESATNATIQLRHKIPDAQDAPIVLSGWCDGDGNILEDTTLRYTYIAPDVELVHLVNYTTIEINFNQPLPPEAICPELFEANEIPDGFTKVEPLSEDIYHLILKRPIPDALEANLFITNLILPGGDTIPKGPYTLFYHEAAFTDLIFSEIMHDPSPPALLAEAEYIELFNRSNLPVNLKNMTLQINDKVLELPEYHLFPDNYVALTAEETNLPGTLTPERWIALTNSGGQIVLRNPSGQTTTAFRYPGLLSGPPFKQEGGWSMECTDANNLSGALSNWAYCSNDRGGTPGMENSVRSLNTDTQSPTVEDAWLEGDSILKLDFGEPIEPSSIKKDDFKLSVSDITIKKITQHESFRDVLTLLFTPPLTQNQVITLSWSSGLSDLAGNIYTGTPQLLFGLPGITDSLDAVINELLFDPPAEGCDYVELYNRSDKILALDSLCLARGGDNDIAESLVLLSDKCRWFLPGTWLCFATDPDWVKKQFNQPDADNILALKGLPNFVNEGGSVILALRNGAVIDHMDYSPSLHYALLSNTKGVALERTSFGGATDNPMTWHSAASTAGYGTPGYTNSQTINTEIKQPEKLFSVSPDIFTPNMDGNNDQLKISYQFKKPGKKGTFTIYNADGFQVKKLVNNQSLGTSGIITWDGTNDDRAAAPPGIYIIGARIFDEEGKVENAKESCVLGVRRH